MKEEHIVLIQEPGEKYLGHVSSVKSDSLTTLDAIDNYFNVKDIPMTKLRKLNISLFNLILYFHLPKILLLAFY